MVLNLVKDKFMVKMLLFWILLMLLINVIEVKAQKYLFEEKFSTDAILPDGFYGASFSSIREGFSLWEPNKKVNYYNSQHTRYKIVFRNDSIFEINYLKISEKPRQKMNDEFNFDTLSFLIPKYNLDKAIYIHQQTKYVGIYSKTLDIQEPYQTKKDTLPLIHLGSKKVVFKKGIKQSGVKLYRNHLFEIHKFSASSGSDCRVFYWVSDVGVIRVQARAWCNSYSFSQKSRQEIIDFLLLQIYKDKDFSHSCYEYQNDADCD